MADKVISAIESGTIQSSDISFRAIRRLAAKDHGRQVWEALDRGRAIPRSHEQLDQYLYTHGPMVECQWNDTLQSVPLPEGDLEIVDYACGQGLGSMLLLDKFRGTHLQRVSNVTLIEPSKVALKRAARVLQCYCPNAHVAAINKRLDALTESDLHFQKKTRKIHLFSNILDMEGFDPTGLLLKVLHNTGKGSHLLMAVSPHRHFEGGTLRVAEALGIIVGLSSNGRHTIRHNSGLKQFKCGRRSVVSFCVRIEV